MTAPVGGGRLEAEYVLPVRWTDDRGSDEVAAYLATLAVWLLERAVCARRALAARGAGAVRPRSDRLPAAAHSVRSPRRRRVSCA